MKSRIYEKWKDTVAWSNQPYPCMSKSDFFNIIRQAKEEVIDDIDNLTLPETGEGFAEGIIEGQKNVKRFLTERHLSTSKKEAT